MSIQNNRELEVIALNENDILELNKTNIDRIELCINIEEDGLTPNKDLILFSLKNSTKNINVMVRNSNTFILSHEEEEELLKFISYLATLKDEHSNLAGVVLGYVTKDNKLNEEFLKKVNLIRKNLNVTFHKACDTLFANNEILKLKQYNINTILTQGGTDKITNNIHSILAIKENFSNDIQILLGGGINNDNIENILKLNTSIHLGSLARIDNSFNKGYNIEYINKLKERMK